MHIGVVPMATVAVGTLWVAAREITVEAEKPVRAMAATTRRAERLFISIGSLVVSCDPKVSWTHRMS
jgi:hypothetical protein